MPKTLTRPHEPHVHRWRIEEPSGSESAGRCACGEIRVFQNWLPTLDFISRSEYQQQ